MPDKMDTGGNVCQSVSAACGPRMGELTPFCNRLWVV